mgnify:CR=1 FL=1
MKVSAVRCNHCRQTVYSRARHDFRTCKCFHNEAGSTGVAVDGGRDYFKLLYGDAGSYEVLELDIRATDEVLYDDWNKGFNNYGILNEDG